MGWKEISSHGDAEQDGNETICHRLHPKYPRDPACWGEPPVLKLCGFGRGSHQKMPFFCALPLAVQEDAEPGAHTPVRDEPLRQPSVRVHFQHFPG